MLVLVEVLCVLAIAVGVGLVYLPAGIVVGGILGVLACELATARHRADQASPAPTGPGA